MISMALFGKKKPEHKQSKLQKQQQVQQHAQKKGGGGKLLAIAVVIIVVIAVASYFLFFLNVNQVVISSPTTVNITQAGNLYSINSNQYYISLSKVSITTGTVYIHITKFPIFVNPLFNVTLTLNNITKLNLGTNYSNLGIQLESISANNVTVKISPLFTSLQIAPSSSDIRVVQTSLFGGSSGSIQQTTVVSTVVSTSATTTGTSTAGTTAPTTTIAKTNQTEAAILAALQKDSYYALMLNFSKLYANTSNCNMNLYDNLYVKENGHLPSGPSSYENVSPFTPYNLSSTTTLSSGGTYNVSYVGKTVALGNLPAVTINVNPTTGATEDTIAPASSSGIFADLTLAQIQSNYATAYLQGSCGVMVT